MCPIDYHFVCDMVSTLATRRCLIFEENAQTTTSFILLSDTFLSQSFLDLANMLSRCGLNKMFRKYISSMHLQIWYLQNWYVYIAHLGVIYIHRLCQNKLTQLHYVLKLKNSHKNYFLLDRL